MKKKIIILILLIIIEMVITKWQQQIQEEKDMFLHIKIEQETACMNLDHTEAVRKCLRDVELKYQNQIESR